MTAREPAIASGPELRCWEITYTGITAYVAHELCGKARMFAARGIEEAGFASVSKALVTLKCRRASEYDHLALARGRPGYVHPEWEVRRDV